MPELPEPEISLWKRDFTETTYPTLTEDIEVDVAIVGAGITGLTTAYLLTQRGLKVAVLDKTTVGGGTTGRTTAKVTSQHNLIYASLLKRLGQQVARTYGEANQSAITQIEKIIKQEKISCDWQRADHYVYTAESNQIEKIKSETEAAESLGLPATFETSVGLPFDTVAAVKFADQAAFHPLKYVRGLAEAVAAQGGHIFEKSNVVRIKDGDPGFVATKKAKVVAQQIVVATNVPTLPLAARGGYCAVEYPQESYIVAGRLSKKQAGMYISPDKHNYSLLPITIGDERWLLVGGENHLSGARVSKEAKFRKLANYAKQNFGVESIEYKWSDRDYLSYDDVPLVGKLYPWSKNLYVATAMMKWGMTNGTVAAMILADTLTGQPNKWAETFDSSRFGRRAAAIPHAIAKYFS